MIPNWRKGGMYFTQVISREDKDKTKIRQKKAKTRQKQDKTPQRLDKIRQGTITQDNTRHDES